MRLIRVHVDAALAPGARVTLAGTATVHLRRVLRLEAGDAVTLFNGDGADYPSRIAAFGRGTAEAEVTDRVAARAESPLAITLMQGIARTERMDLVVQKATELGVAAIVPIATARGVVRLDAATRARKRAHWQAIAVAACEQCGRARVPAVAEPRTLDAFLADPRPDGTRLLLSPDAQVSLGAVAQVRRRSRCWSVRKADWTTQNVSRRLPPAGEPAVSGRACCAAKPPRSRRSPCCSRSGATWADPG
jgi:16S rRNA (uracil1498-N3)-methyltransferase